jgi:hypothetical protein
LPTSDKRDQRDPGDFHDNGYPDMVEARTDQSQIPQNGRRYLTYRNRSTLSNVQDSISWRVAGSLIHKFRQTYSIIN